MCASREIHINLYFLAPTCILVGTEYWGTDVGSIFRLLRTGGKRETTTLKTDHLQAKTDHFLTKIGH